MARKGKAKGNRKKVKENTERAKKWNFVNEAGPGCHIARRDAPNSFVLEWEDVANEEFDDEDANSDYDSEEEEEDLDKESKRNIFSNIVIVERSTPNSNQEVLDELQSSSDNFTDSFSQSEYDRSKNDNVHFMSNDIEEMATLPHPDELPRWVSSRVLAHLFKSCVPFMIC